MSFDRDTRNRLARVVGQARERLKTDAMDQLRRLGFQEDGTILDLERIEGLTEGERTAGDELRAELEHLRASERGEERARRRAAYDRLAREIGFTTLNRLVALRMAEERGLIVEAVGQGYASAGFQLYERVANGALGGRAETYRAFLESLYDEIALDLPALFDRSDPQSWVFPSERCLEEVLGLLNDSAIAPLWQEDEAIGWVYQYYNDPDERRQMRESQAPRNSRELAVRNQFFTPRYVVEFLTDNTLGRTWYEMRRGETRLVDECRYLVRRKHPLWLAPGENPPEPFPADGDPVWQPNQRLDELGLWTCPNPDIEEWPPLAAYALTVDGYAVLPGRNDVPSLSEFFGERYAEHERTGKWDGTFEELRACLYMAQRIVRHLPTEDPTNEQLQACLALNRALCERWDLEVESIPHLPKKEPRELRILDPACGSGHFLLYAFDLLLTIYDEAYDDLDLGPALQAEFPDRAGYDRLVPAMILHNNLHGIDIDPRACQIAALALWLRAQRHWQEIGLQPAERPRIRKTHIVCAEPMPGERDLLEEYLTTVDSRLRPLVRTVWERMQLAGEAGSLLKIEEAIRESLREARVEALVDAPPQQVTLYDRDQKPRQSLLTLASTDDIAFWDQAEAKLLDALQAYATQAANGKATQRRLFAGDAAQGFALIDVCRSAFDVVIMNPPFGEASEATRPIIDGANQDWNRNLLCAFIARAAELTSATGFIGAIFDKTALVKSSYKDFRDVRIYPETGGFLFGDLGWGILDGASVEAALGVFGGRPNPDIQLLRCSDLPLDERADPIAEAIAEVRQGKSCRRLVRYQRGLLRRFPNGAIPFDVEPWVVDVVGRCQTFEQVIGRALAGHSLKADINFRLFWEIPPLDEIGQGKYWSTLYNGSEYSLYATPLHDVTRYGNDGNVVPEHVSTRWCNRRDQQKPGIAWGKRGDFVDTHVMPAGAVFTVEGQGLPLLDRRWLALGLMNSRLFWFLMNLFCGQHKYAGYVNACPVPPGNPELTAAIEQATAATTELVRSEFRYDETTREFAAPRFTARHSSLRELAEALYRQASERLNRFAELDETINRLVERWYGIMESTGHAHREAAERTPQPGSFLNLAETTDDFARSIAVDLVSFAVGCAFGRWDVRFARNPEFAPRHGDPFAPLPDWAPAMLVSPDGRPAQRIGDIASESWLRHRALESPVLDPFGQGSTVGSPEDYPIPLGSLTAGRGGTFPTMLPEDPDHQDDIVGRIRAVLRFIAGPNAEAIEYEVCDLVGVAELRDYIRRPRGFFADHVRIHTRSRRQAPIYWPLSTEQSSYTLWISYHRLGADSLYAAVNHYVQPEVDRLASRQSEAEAALAAATGREATRLRGEVEDLRGRMTEVQQMADELRRVASLPYRPNLRDGVLLTAAPLHNLMQGTAWVRNLRQAWAELVAGEKDWSSIALAIWPDRVREKSRTDRSLATAHNLEHLYEAPAAEAKAARGRKRRQTTAFVEKDA